jgi:cation diffusion facilitator CzcD-associated flavoprotein CzcO
MNDTHAAPGAHITGEGMYQYLAQYAEKWDITRRIDFETTVDEVTRLADSSDGWRLSVRKANTVQPTILETKQLIVATGVTYRPHRPLLPSAKPGDSSPMTANPTTFNAPIVHSIELGKQVHHVISKAASNIAVLGGAKSAYDAVFLAATAGKHVHWIIRASGKGPVWVFPPFTQLGPIKAWREMLPVRRFIACFSPWLWEDLGGTGWLRGFLHHTWLGKKVAQAFWQDIHHATLRDCRYKEKGRPELRVLEPEQSPFWYGTASGVYSYPGDEVYEALKEGRVTVYRADIVGFEDKVIELSDGKKVPVDVLVTATGFSAQPAIKFSPSSMHSDLGLPSTELSVEQDKLWAQLEAKADEKIGQVYPRLTKGPFKSPKSDVVQPFNNEPDPNANFTPWRLYRSMAPPGLTVDGKRDLVFIGMFHNVSNFTRIELQCLWAYAYLKGALDEVLPQGQKMYEETALWTRFWQLRAPYGHGRFFADAVFDQVPTFDLWLRDLGLRTRRKASWWKELTQAYTVQDYKDIVQEWLALRER